MRRINLTELRVGMRVERDVASPRGPVLAAAGTTVTARHLSGFRAWGVRDLYVVVPEPAEAPAPAQAQNQDQERDEAAARVRRRFEHYDLDDPVHREMFYLAVRSADAQRGAAP